MLEDITIEEVLARYVDFYNNHRPCYAIGYDTLVNYRERYHKGELEKIYLRTNSWYDVTILVDN